MKTERTFRGNRGAQLLTVMLTLALVVGFASVGQAQDVAELVVTAEKPRHDVTAALIRDEMQSAARLAANKTRVTVVSDLGERLSKENRPARVAVRKAVKTGERG
jgi:hypothetical protein